MLKRWPASRSGPTQRRGYGGPPLCSGTSVLPGWKPALSVRQAMVSGPMTCQCVFGTLSGVSPIAPRCMQERCSNALTSPWIPGSRASATRGSPPGGGCSWRKPVPTYFASLGTAADLAFQSVSPTVSPRPGLLLRSLPTAEGSEFQVRAEAKVAPDRSNGLSLTRRR